MTSVVRLRDLGGGEPNDDLTWALFDESRKGGQAEPATRRDSDRDSDDTPEGELEASMTLKASKSRSRRGAAGRRKS